MTIPEPTDYDRLAILKSMYEKISDAKSTAFVPVSRETALAVISRAYHAERERDQLRAKLHDSDRIGTHYDGCWDSGTRHYACAVAEITKLRARVAELEAAKGVAGENMS